MEFMLVSLLNKPQQCTSNIEEFSEFPESCRRVYREKSKSNLQYNNNNNNKTQWPELKTSPGMRIPPVIFLISEILYAFLHSKNAMSQNASFYQKEFQLPS